MHKIKMKHTHKAMDVNVLDWEQQSTVGLWDNGGFDLNKEERHRRNNGEEKK